MIDETQVGQPSKGLRVVEFTHMVMGATCIHLAPMPGRDNPWSVYDVFTVVEESKSRSSALCVTAMSRGARRRFLEGTQVPGLTQ